MKNPSAAGGTAQKYANSLRPITVSVVSHGQGELVGQLLNDLNRYSAQAVEVVLTVNIEEKLPFDWENYGFPVKVINNAAPRGFGANHNVAFREKHGQFFCVLNPDIRLTADPFATLLTSLQSSKVGVVAPLVRNAQGAIEDSARRIPTPWRIAAKLFVRKTRPDYSIGDKPIFPDWVAGMFMCFRSDVYERMAGFDERYFLYYEDVDLCSRLRLAGYRIVLDPLVSVIHDARRESHRNFRYLRWHLRSICRFFMSSTFLRHMLGQAGRKAR